MNEINILDKLKPSSFGKETDEIEIEAAVFLTYSIDCKSILGALISMMAEDVMQKDVDIVECWKQCLRRGLSGKPIESTEKALKELQEKVAFVCNDGYDKSTSSPVYMYTRELTYYYSWSGAKHSFHPKLYIVKYKRNDELYFRFMVGSMNLVNSKNKEFIVAMDMKAYVTKPVDGKEYAQCTVVNDLLGMDSEYYSKNIRNNKARLTKVIRNLELDQCWFEKGDIDRFVVFPKKNVAGPLPDANIVISPFLSKALVDNMKNTKLYTMESELRKLGYVVKPKENVTSGQGEANEKIFYVYSVKEGEKAFNHIKMYANDTHVYVGSANFTGSALGRKEEKRNQKTVYNIGKNKEVLVRLDFDAFFKKNLQEYLNGNYRAESFIYQEGHKEEKEPIDQFRELAEEIAGSLEQEIKKDNNDRSWICKLNIVNAKDKQGKSIEWKKAVETWKKQANAIVNNSEIKIAPFRCKMDAKALDSLSWTIANRMKLDDAFVFGLYVDDKPKYSFTYHIDMMNEEMTKVENGLNDTIQMTLLRLESLLENKGINSSTITKEMEEIEKGTLRKDAVGYVRRSLPSLEALIKKNLECESISMDRISQRIGHLESIKDVLRNKSLTDEEKKVLGIDSSNIKIINNMLEQGDLLLKEFG